MSDNTGKSVVIPLATNDINTSLQDGMEAYKTYDVELTKDGYQPQCIHGVQIFANIHSTLYMNMIPNGIDHNEVLTSRISMHHLQKTFHNIATTSTPKRKGGANDMLRDVIIPTNITVHLGRPSSNAENLTVPFLYYLKNVASSEVYPSWPSEALKANIWAQISLVLNRVFTEWYPSQGYNFDITNSTAFDQAFVKNRNIYDNMAAIVDEVFNEYVQKRNFQEPYYAEYCDGKIAQCPGMKQWGTLDLANRGYDALSILRYYYGDEIAIVSSNNIKNINSSYPGTPLTLGDEGEIVAQLQAQLNGIAINYPNIKPIFPVNGIFGPTTDAAVRVFQKQFNLTIDGIVGKATYYKISFVYVAVRKLAELGSLGHLKNLYSGVWQGRVLRFGDRGVETQLVQYYLSSISLFYPEIPSVSIDGRFGNSTQNAVVAFQKRFGLISDGLIGQATWNRIYEIYTSIEDEIPDETTPPPYPGTPLRFGSRGNDVRTLQQALNQVATQYTTIPSIRADGLFGTSTRTAVQAFQRIFNLVVDGIVGKATWDLIFSTAAGITTKTASTPVDDITQTQQKLSYIKTYYPKQMPQIEITSTFDDQTRNSLFAFQKMMGILEHGELDKTTQDVINQMYEEIQREQ